MFRRVVKFWKVTGSTIAKVGVAPPRLSVWYLSSSLSESIRISRISFQDSTWALSAHETSPRCTVNKTSVQLTRKQEKSLLNEVEILQAVWWYNAQMRYNVPFPNLGTVTQRPVSRIPKSFITKTFQSIYWMHDVTNCTVHFQHLCHLCIHG